MKTKEVIAELEAIRIRIGKLIAELSGAGYVCQCCGKACPPDWFWYTWTNDRGDLTSPVCAPCVRIQKTGKSEGPFKLPVTTPTPTQKV